MPAKVKLFVFLTSLSILLELLTAQWAPLLISSVLLAAVLETRSEGRSQLLLIVQLAVAGAALVVLLGAVDVATGHTLAGIETIGGGALALLPAAFYRWCFDHLDVVRWMVHRHEGSSASAP